MTHLPSPGKIASAFACLILCSSCADNNQSGRIAVIESDTREFGSYPASERKTARFRITNIGRRKLNIIKTWKSCACAEVSASTSSLAPSETAQVDLTILPDSVTGKYSHYALIETDDPYRQYLRLTVKGEAIPLVKVAPQNDLYVAHIPTNTPWQITFDLRPTQPDVILGHPTIHSDHEIAVSLNDSTSDDGKAYQLTVHLPAQQDSGDWQCTLEIPIVNPRGKKPLRISAAGSIGSRLVVIPRTITLPFSDTPLSRSVSLRVLAAPGDTFDFTRLSLPTNNMVEASMSPTDRDDTVKVFLRFSAGFAQSLLSREQVKLRFAMPQMASASLICQSDKAARTGLTHHQH